MARLLYNDKVVVNAFYDTGIQQALREAADVIDESPSGTFDTVNISVEFDWRDRAWYITIPRSR